MIVVDADTVQRVLTMPRAIDAVDAAMRALSRGELIAPSRLWLPVAEHGEDLFGLMPGTTRALDVYGAKLVTLHPSNRQRDLPVIQGSVLLFDRESGTPRALIDGAAVTAIRTAAASAVASRALAKTEATTHGVLGTGVQAATHVGAIAAVRPIEKTVVWGRRFEAAETFARDEAARTGLDIRATEDVREAAGCDIVSTVTAATSPVLRGNWLAPGAHVNLVGAHEKDARESDSDLIASARVYVDWLESVMSQSGDILLPIEEGRIDADHVLGEIGAVLEGDLAGRSSDTDITVYVSLGVVAQDLFAAADVLAALAQ